jgi:hypothetical protein
MIRGNSLPRFHGSLFPAVSYLTTRSPLNRSLSSTESSDAAAVTSADFIWLQTAAPMDPFPTSSFKHSNMELLNAETRM